MIILALGHSLQNDPIQEANPYVEAEARILWELMAAGILREVFYFKDWHSVVLILNCRDLEEARQWLQTLPTAKSRLYDYHVSELVPFQPLRDLFENHHLPTPKFWL